MPTNRPLCDSTHLFPANTFNMLLSVRSATRLDYTVSWLSKPPRDVVSSAKSLSNYDILFTCCQYVLSTLYGVSTYVFSCKRLNSSCSFLEKYVSNILFLVCKTLHNMTIFLRCTSHHAVSCHHRPSACSYVPQHTLCVCVC